MSVGVATDQKQKHNNTTFILSFFKGIVSLQLLFILFRCFLVLFLTLKNEHVLIGSQNLWLLNSIHDPIF